MNPSLHRGDIQSVPFDCFQVGAALVNEKAHDSGNVVNAANGKVRLVEVERSAPQSINSHPSVTRHAWLGLNENLPKVSGLIDAGKHSARTDSTSSTKD